MEDPPPSNPKTTSIVVLMRSQIHLIWGEGGCREGESLEDFHEREVGDVYQRWWGLDEATMASMAGHMMHMATDA